MLRNAVSRAGAVNSQLPSNLFRPTARAIYDRRYVRLAGMTSYASRDDVIYFMERNGVDVSSLKRNSDLRFAIPARSHFRRGEPNSTAEAESESYASSLSSTGTANVVDMTTADMPEVPLLAQGQSDVFLNHAVWVYDAGSKDNAQEAAAKLSGKICGLKLIRAAAVDGKLVDDMIGVNSTKNNNSQSTASVPLRRRMTVIAPLPQERDRAVLLMSLPAKTSPRSLWSFFGAYDVAAVRLLRRDRVASIVFRTPDEARRAIRERSNLPLYDHGRLTMKLHG